eukprot:TRINITY_DN50267_c0_g1_i1.p1 TRINITY_DN50267_c0_g1~~TRINITY_DN50267_c0_g1_i1.p1  ORF type:complete len:222 (+),score=20.19 TRINITY_DN50267_c0_g1_i1:67-732(+)
MVFASAQVTSKDVNATPVKTRKCRFFGMGICTRGETCKFAHVTAEARPPLNVSRTKMCPALLKTGMCQDEKCDHAHRREDLQTKRDRPRRRGNRKRKVPGQRDTSLPSNQAMLSDDTCLPSLDNNGTCKARSGVSTVKREPVDSSVSVIATCSFENASTLARSVRDVMLSRAFAHNGYHVVVKKTFIHVEHKDTSFLGIRRAATAPGSINDKFDMRKPRCK